MQTYKQMVKTQQKSVKTVTKLNELSKADKNQYHIAAPTIRPNVQHVKQSTNNQQQAITNC